MRNLLAMLAALQTAGRFTPGFHVRIENSPYMPLVIDDIQQPGPDGHRVISFTHYGEHNGDLMRDPEMLFQLVEEGDKPQLLPFYFRNDYAGFEDWSRYQDDQGRVLVKPRMQQEQLHFARLWDRNLKEQGFLEALQTALLKQ
jgi:hypothetical protein